nr:DUF5750 family protein [Methanothermobacter sp. K4]
MQVKVEDFGFSEDKCMNYVLYRVSDIDDDVRKKLMERLEEDTEEDNGDLLITVFYAPEYFPFGSEEAKVRMDDFIAREEIEMTVFLSSVLED